MLVTHLLEGKPPVVRSVIYEGLKSWFPLNDYQLRDQTQPSGPSIYSGSAPAQTDGMCRAFALTRLSKSGNEEFTALLSLSVTAIALKVELAEQSFIPSAAHTSLCSRCVKYRLRHTRLRILVHAIQH